MAIQISTVQLRNPAPPLKKRLQSVRLPLQEKRVQSVRLPISCQLSQGKLLLQSRKQSLLHQLRDRQQLPRSQVKQNQLGKPQLIQ